MIHKARVIPYRDLLDGLRENVEQKLIYERGDGDLRLFNYTPNCVYDKQWNDFTRIARGLVIDVKREQVIATPFEKFWNLNERPDEPLPDLPFEVFEKLDGSLIALFWDGNGWRCTTRGSFNSQQAQDAKQWFTRNLGFGLVKGHTYLCEWVGPSNKIVVPYDQHELVLLAIYDDAGYEHSWALVQHTAERLGWRAARRYEFESLADLVEHAARLPAIEEGFVLRYTNGHRIKVKGDEYRRVHALISDCTPLAIWNAMLAGDNMEMLRRELPEEFWGDFDNIIARLNDKLTCTIMRAEMAAEQTLQMSDKELGLILHTYPEDVRRFLFPFRKHGNLMEGKSREAVFRAVRPTANVLAGYTPSFAMNRVMEESV